MTREQSNSNSIQGVRFDSSGIFAGHPGVSRFLIRFVARHRRLALLRAIGWGVALALIWFLISCLTDRLFHLPRSLRVLWLASDVAVFGFMMLPTAARLFARPIDWIEAANQVERLTPRFGQRLQTAASQMLERPAYRGSQPMLDSILNQVDSQIRAVNLKSLISLLPVWRAWTALASVVVLCAALIVIPGLGMPRLLSRGILPWRDLSPVTTTTLIVEPGDAQVPQGRDLNITVNAQRVGDALPVIATSEDGNTWQRQTMTYLSPDRFSFVLSNIDRDLKYFVKGGDTQSPSFTIHALRPPAVIEFRVRYAFPPYVLRPPALPASCADGVISAPAGTQAAISVVCTEPLASATIQIAGQRLSMAPTNDPNMRECKILIDQDEKLKLTLLSDRGIGGSGPPSMAIHAIADLPPVVRLTQPGEDMQLSRHEIVPVKYLVTDDYGVTYVGVRAQVNLSPGHEFTAFQDDGGLTDDPAYRRGTFMLDLARLDLKTGDLVRLCLVARDSGGHETVGSEERFILISPRAVDFTAHLRMTQLRQAQSLAQLVLANLDAADKAMRDMPPSNHSAPARDPQSLSDAREALFSASDAAALLRQSLLRAVVQSDSQSMSIALANWLDQTQRIAARVDRVSQWLDSASPGQTPAELSFPRQDASRLAEDISTVAAGEVAVVLAAEQQETKIKQGQPPIYVAGALTAGQDIARTSIQQQPGNTKAVRQRMDEQFRAAAAALKLDPNADDFSSRLANLIETEKALLARQTPVNFVPAAQNWASDLKQGGGPSSDLEARLAIAAEAEALRPEGNLICARDLQLSSRAAAAIESNLPSTSLTAAVASQQFPPALEDLQREANLQYAMDHQFRTDAHPDNPADEILMRMMARRQRDIRVDAEIARQKMAQWAADLSATQPQDALGQEQRTVDAAMQANAAAARGDYAVAAMIDKTMSPPRPAGKPTEAAAIPPSARQSSSPVASSIASMNPPEQSFDLDRAISQRQVLLAMQSASNLDAIRARQDQLISDAAHGANTLELAKRQQSVADEIRKLNVTSPLEPAANIEPIVTIQVAINSLNTLQSQWKTWKVTAWAEQRLRAGLNALIDRNPLSTSQSFAGQAAGELSQPDAAPSAALASQRTVSLALSRAWEQSIHRAAANRLEQSPTLAAILEPDSDDLHPSPQTTGNFASPTARITQEQWTRLQNQKLQSISAGARETSAAGYEESIKAYFEALNRIGG
jgi:hypothetical protein